MENEVQEIFERQKLVFHYPLIDLCDQLVTTLRPRCRTSLRKQTFLTVSDFLFTVLFL